VAQIPSHYRKLVIKADDQDRTLNRNDVERIPLVERIATHTVTAPETPPKMEAPPTNADSQHR